MRPSGPIGAIVLSFPGTQERLETFLIFIDWQFKCFIFSRGGKGWLDDGLGSRTCWDCREAQPVFLLPRWGGERGERGDVSDVNLNSRHGTSPCQPWPSGLSLGWVLSSQFFPVIVRDNHNNHGKHFKQGNNKIIWWREIMRLSLNNSLKQFDQFFRDKIRSQGGSTERAERTGGEGGLP